MDGEAVDLVVDVNTMDENGLPVGVPRRATPSGSCCAGAYVVADVGGGARLGRSASDRCSEPTRREQASGFAGS